MKIDRIVSAFTYDDNYMQFLGITSRAWNGLTGLPLTVAYIKTGNFEKDQGVAAAVFAANIDNKENFIDLHFFNPIEGIHPGIQAKVTRMYLAQRVEDSFAAIVDIDMIPLQETCLDYAEAALGDDHLVKFGYDHPSFQAFPDVGKWPMDKTAAKGSTFKEIVNPEDLSYNKLLKSWTGFEQDRRSNIFLPFSGFSDESLLRCLEQQWNHPERVTKVARGEMPGEYANVPNTLYGRLEKHKYPTLNGINVSKYFEVHGPRPLLSNHEWYKPVYDYFEEKGIGT